ncbi:rhodanese-like domain-containing protein [Arenicella xantha]|uniref:Phage shock protein E n=1 Tax=Arenicella xantha TaxID=644221 RepID=A0A395JLV2_9GAMM|nr:rhodanese-like domain-containing protein [Arenicella xantha]RBP51405.1 phage shock protein E [Arenicella xantha]
MNITQKIVLIAVALLISGNVAAQQSPEYVDVRSWAEHQLDSIDGDLRIPMSDVVSGIQQKFPDKATPIRLYCAVGGRASKAAQQLRSVGYTDVTSVGGIDDARAIRQLAEE